MFAFLNKVYHREELALPNLQLVKLVAGKLKQIRDWCLGKAHDEEVGIKG